MGHHGVFFFVRGNDVRDKLLSYFTILWPIRAPVETNRVEFNIKKISSSLNRTDKIIPRFDSMFVNESIGALDYWQCAANK